MKKLLLSSSILFFVLIGAVAQAPNISYASPQTYDLGKNISPLSPTNIGGTPYASGVTTTFAGSGIQGSADGTGSDASFYRPQGITIDLEGNVYVADTYNNKIRRISVSGVVTTFAGTGTIGSTDGTGTVASFYWPFGITVDLSGNIYIAENYNHKIRKITPDGDVTTLAGSGQEGYADGTGTAASFRNPSGIAVDASGNVYVTDTSNNRIRKITPAGVVTTLAGGPTTGSTDGTGSAARFYNPIGLAVDASGKIYVGDYRNNKIRKITSEGIVTTLAGTGKIGNSDGPGSQAAFNLPIGVAVDIRGNVFVADSGNHRVREINSDGIVFTLAGSNTAGAIDAKGSAASFNSPHGVAVDATGIVYVADKENNKIRKITSGGYFVFPQLPPGLTLDSETGTISGKPTVASAQTTYIITAYNAIGSSTTSIDITVNSLDKPEITYESPQTYVIGTPITPLTPVNIGGTPWAQLETSTFAGNGYFGSVDDIDTAASFYFPRGIASDTAGNYYVADSYNNKIRKITPGGEVTTFAGSGTPYYNEGVGIAASFHTPSAVAVDASGNVYVADTENHRIRKITPGGQVSTLSGNGSPGYQDGNGSSASFLNPQGVAVDAAGDVYVADTGNNKIRRISPTGYVTTFGGNKAQFSSPQGVAVDASGNVYVANTGYNTIVKITPNLEITTLAGKNYGSSDGNGTSASFYNPRSLTLDAAGNVFVADAGNNKIRKIAANGDVTTLAGNGIGGSADQLGNLSSFKNPSGITVDSYGNLYIADLGNNKVRKIHSGGYTIKPALPAGLNFDASTGSISGVPTAVSPKTTYSITASNFSGSSTTTIDLAVVEYLGIEQNAASIFAAYPNPVSDVLMLQMKDNYQNLSVEVINLQGQVLMKSNFNDGPNHSINVAQLASGNYLLKVKADDIQATQKFIKI